MAFSIMKSLSFFFLVVVISISLVKIEASDRLFFSKVDPSSNNYYNNALNPKLPISFDQNVDAKQPPPQFPTLTSNRQARPPPPPPKLPGSFSRDEYRPYEFSDSNFGDRKNNNEDKNNKKDNDVNDQSSFIYNMENRDDDISGELKQQGFVDARASLEMGRGSFGREIEGENRFNNGYKRGAAWSGSAARNDEDDKPERGNAKQNEFGSLDEYENYLRRNGFLE